MASACPSLADRTVRDANDACALFAGIAAAPTERCGFAYLDPEWRLLGTLETTPGSMHGAGVPLRMVLADLLRLDAAAVIMVHNHPSGDTRPSAADIAVTRRVMMVLEAIDVRLIDHIVLAGGSFASMREMGLL